ncbi:WD40 repeat domain-containing protein [Frankia casuarinae]|uniref:WD40 repeat domain-containing protein n=1 Tax=Frankia casuarinae (strain DSM 45818 / CECT 9043 / HFP020203 / CcI3) TaxID=106370 RepID=UPI0036F2D294
MATLTGHTGPVETLAFDGTMLATAGDDTTARLWDLNPTSLTRRACTTPTGRLSEDEWHRYLPTFPYQPPCP